jgi:DNA-binding MarR family transcriptional regulator
METMMIKQHQGVWEFCTHSAVRRAARQLGQLYDGMMGDAGLRGTQFSLLTQIVHLEMPTQKMLAEALVMDLSALGHTLKPLIRDGLVELIVDEKDRRAKRVRLTQDGIRQQQAMLADWERAQARFDAAFGKQKSEELRRALAFIASPEFAKAFREET